MTSVSAPAEAARPADAALSAGAARSAGAALAAAADEALLLRLGAGRFAVGLSHVAEVARVPAVTRVPGVPSWLAGVSNWRGRIVPVLDLRTVLGAVQQPLTDGARLVVLTSEHSNVALLVEGIDGIAAVGDEVAALPEALAAGAGLISGQIPRADGPVAMLDVAAVVRLRETLPRAGAGA